MPGRYKRIAVLAEAVKFSIYSELAVGVAMLSRRMNNEKNGEKLR